MASVKKACFPQRKRTSTSEGCMVESWPPKPQAVPEAGESFRVCETEKASLERDTNAFPCSKQGGKH